MEVILKIDISSKNLIRLKVRDRTGVEGGFTLSLIVIVPLGADKKRHCKSRAHLIEMCCKRQFFKQYDFNTFIFCGPTLGSDHRSHSPCH